MFYWNEPQVAILEVKSYMLSGTSITIKPLLTNKYLLLTINYLVQTLYVFWGTILQKISMHAPIHNCLFSHKNNFIPNKQRLL